MVPSLVLASLGLGPLLGPCSWALALSVAQVLSLALALPRPSSIKDVQSKLFDLSVFLRHLEHGCDADLIPDSKLFAMKARKSAARAEKGSTKQNWMNQGTAELAHINAHNKLPGARSSQRQGWFQAGQLMESAVEEVTVNKTSQIAGGNAVFALTSGRDGELVGSFLAW